MLTHAELLAAVLYDRETGKFFDRVTGRVLGTRHTVRGGAYWRIRFRGKRYLAHVLAYFYCTGKWPEHQVDHRDTDGLNNRWENLRDATHQQNQYNRRVYNNNALGVKGVRATRTGKFSARVCIRGKAKHLGTFASVEEARDAFLKYAREIQGDFTYDDNFSKSDRGFGVGKQCPADDVRAALSACDPCRVADAQGILA